MMTGRLLGELELEGAAEEGALSVLEDYYERRAQDASGWDSYIPLGPSFPIQAPQSKVNQNG